MTTDRRLVMVRDAVFAKREDALVAGYPDAVWGFWVPSNGDLSRATYGWQACEVEQDDPVPMDIPMSYLIKQMGRAGTVAHYPREFLPTELHASTVRHLASFVQDDPDHGVIVLHPEPNVSVWFRPLWLRQCGNHLVCFGTRVSGYDFSQEEGDLWVTSVL